MLLLCNNFNPFVHTNQTHTVQAQPTTHTMSCLYENRGDVPVGEQVLIYDAMQLLC
jgi:hypothetical protein